MEFENPLLERMRALNNLMREALTTEFSEDDNGKCEVRWRSGGDTVLAATVFDKDAALLLSALPHLVSIALKVLEEDDFMGTIPKDIVDECNDVIRKTFEVDEDGPHL